MTPDNFIILTYTCFGLLLGILASLTLFLLGYIYNSMRMRRDMIQPEMIPEENGATAPTAPSHAVIIKNPLNGRHDDPTNVPV